MSNSNDKPVFEVASEKCATCIFSPNSPIGPSRLKEHIQDTLKGDSYAICHTAQINLGRDSKVACRGFFDRYKNDTLTMRLAQMLGIVQEVRVYKEESQQP